jgi:dethiobiotin synthetase
MRGLFITGTDTGVGKTTLAAALLTVLRQRGVNAAPMKPVHTGCLRRGSRLIVPDLEFCLAAADLNPVPEERLWMCPYPLMLASSPHLAAQQARLHISKETIVRCFHKILRRYDTVLVEGAGGVLAPLSWRHTMLDLMKTLGLSVLLAARPGLGTINHTLLSLRELQRARLRVLGVVFVENRPGPQTLIERDNLRTVRRLGGVPLVVRLPYLPGLARGRATARERLWIERFFQSLEKAF